MIVSMATTNTDPDTTPLRRSTGEKGTGLSDIEVKSPQEHFMINSNGLYGHHQYTDLSLLLKRNILK